MAPKLFLTIAYLRELSGITYHHPFSYVNNSFFNYRMELHDGYIHAWLCFSAIMFVSYVNNLFFSRRRASRLSAGRLCSCLPKRSTGLVSWHLSSTILLLTLFLKPPVLAQEPLQTTNLGIPTDVCNCSEEEKNRFNEAVSVALEKAKSRYNQDNIEVDQQALIESAMKNSGITGADYEKLANMSEAQQQAYAIQMAQQARHNAYNTNTQNQKELMAQYQKAKSNYNDANTIQSLIMPIAIEQTRLEKEAEAWYEDKINPLFEKLNSLYGQAHWNMLHKIEQEERKYCAAFSPRNLNLINKETTALKKLYPVMMDLIERNSFEDVNLDLTATPDADPLIMYLNAIGKAFDYRIHDDSQHDMDL